MDRYFSEDLNTICVNCCHIMANTFLRSVDSTGNTVDTYCHMNIIIAQRQKRYSVLEAISRNAFLMNIATKSTRNLLKKVI